MSDFIEEFPKSITIHVTQEDIDKSTPKCNMNCVLATAALREFKKFDPHNVSLSYVWAEHQGSLKLISYAMHFCHPYGFQETLVYLPASEEDESKAIKLALAFDAYGGESPQVSPVDIDYVYSDDTVI